MTADSLFDNFFDTIHITPTRLRNFADDALHRFSADNENGGWPGLIRILEPAAATLGRELGVVDTTVNIRLGNTDTVDAILKSFGAYMSENEPFIARAIGGKGSPAYLEFYPNGLSEYTRVNKTTAPVLMERVATAAGKYTTQLAEPLTTDLIDFKHLYADRRGTQQGSKGAVDENRGGRTDARKALEKALLRAICQVVDKYPGEVEKCKSYFDFSRLYSSGRHHHPENVGGA